MSNRDNYPQPTGGTEEDAIDRLVEDIIALGTDHPNGAFPDGKNPDGTYAVQNEAEAKAAIQSLLTEARKDELERMNTGRHSGRLGGNSELQSQPEQVKSLTVVPSKPYLTSWCGGTGCDNCKLCLIFSGRAEFIKADERTHKLTYRIVG